MNKKTQEKIQKRARRWIAATKGERLLVPELDWAGSNIYIKKVIVWKGRKVMWEAWKKKCRFWDSCSDAQNSTSKNLHLLLQ